MNDVHRLRGLKLFDPPCAPKDDLLVEGFPFKFLLVGEPLLKLPFRFLFGTRRALVPGLGLNERLFCTAATFFFSI